MILKHRQAGEFILTFGILLKLRISREYVNTLVISTSRCGKVTVVVQCEVYYDVRIGE
jgi:hypothetical protein